MTIFVDILVGVERKSRVWPVGFISIAVFPVGEAEISELLQSSEVIGTDMRITPPGRIGLRRARGSSYHTRWSDSRSHPQVFR